MLSHVSFEQRRKRMTCRSGLALLMLAAAPLAAQQPQMMGHDQQMTDHMRQMEQMMAPMMRAMVSTPDTGAVKMHFQAAHSAMGRAQWAMLSAAAQARGVLTDEQRARVDRWASMMMDHRMERP